MRKNKRKKRRFITNKKNCKEFNSTEKVIHNHNKEAYKFQTIVKNNI